MTNELHHFHIPVMGIGFSIDTPLRAAPFGISSVISLVDDHLCETLREYYSRVHNLPFEAISKNASDSRARRITAYLEILRRLVDEKIAAIRAQPFFQKNEKQEYFDLLPDESPLKRKYREAQSMRPGAERDERLRALAAEMKPGAIDVNIMVKLDRTRNGMGDRQSEAKAALRGFAESSLESSVIFSAGMNPSLFTYLSRFQDFYRDAAYRMKKKITLKVSDFRSALIQSRFLAKRGLEVSEYRIESPLNCGGHAFPSRGEIIPLIMKDFAAQWRHLVDTVRVSVAKYYKENAKPYPAADKLEDPVLTVQGGIGTAGEAQRLRQGFGADGTGWGTPFLLVPQITQMDAVTREKLRSAGATDVYLSDVSPLGVPFNNLRGTTSELWTAGRIKSGGPGSPCPNGHLKFNSEITEEPVCVASRQYQKLKLSEIEKLPGGREEKARLERDVTVKTCICNHLGNGVLIHLGLKKEETAPVAVCPGPNIAWFDRFFSLREMVDHIYGRGTSLVPIDRPHMFASEIVLNVDYFEKLVTRPDITDQEAADLSEFKTNLENGMDLCVEISRSAPYAQENLDSIPPIVDREKARLRKLFQAIGPRS